MRLFVAINIPYDLKLRMEALGQEIAMDGVSPVKSGNIHITLRFIGEVDESKLDDITQRLRGVGFKPFDCSLSGVGVFPSEHYVRVVWVGIEKEESLEGLARDVIRALHGFGSDERFTPHLTIARVKKKLDFKEFLSKHEDEKIGSFRVGSFELMRSDLGKPGGPEYSVVAKFEAR